MSIDKDTVKHIAKLARISLDEKKINSLSKDLSSIMEFIEKLNELNTEKTVPLTSIINASLRSRKDEVSDEKIRDQILKNFLGFITIKNRLFFLDQIIDSFLNIISINKGELKAKLVSSKQLSEKELKNIQSELSKDFKSPIKIDYKYDPNLIAGLIIQVGSVMVDTSIKSKLKQLEKNMVEA